MGGEAKPSGYKSWEGTNMAFLWGVGAVLEEGSVGSCAAGRFEGERGWWASARMGSAGG
jgi:hypothetical protein